MLLEAPDEGAAICAWSVEAKRPNATKATHPPTNVERLGHECFRSDDSDRTERCATLLSGSVQFVGLTFIPDSPIRTNARSPSYSLVARRS